MKPTFIALLKNDIFKIYDLLKKDEKNLNNRIVNILKIIVHVNLKH